MTSEHSLIQAQKKIAAECKLDPADVASSLSAVQIEKAEKDLDWKNSELHGSGIIFALSAIFEAVAIPAQPIIHTLPDLVQVFTTAGMLIAGAGLLTGIVNYPCAWFEKRAFVNEMKKSVKTPAEDSKIVQFVEEYLAGKRLNGPKLS